MGNVLEIDKFRKVKYLKDNILACEIVLKDLDSSMKILSKHKDLMSIRKLLNEIKETNDVLFRFVIKQNKELTKLQSENEDE